MIESKTAKVQGLEVDVVTLSNEMCKAVLTNLGARSMRFDFSAVAPSAGSDFMDTRQSMRCDE